MTTLRPIFSEMSLSKSLIFASFEGVNFGFLFLNIFTKFSDCLTESFFSIILLAIKLALSNPTNNLAWPALIFFFFYEL